MNLKSILTSLFVLVYSFSTAQEPRVYNFFSSISNKTLYCGGKLIEGSLHSYQSSINSWDNFSQDNRFFIDIALDSNSKEYTRIPASRLSLSSPNQAEFLLPDNLEIGKKYRIRMISTSPSLQGNFVSFIYAAGMLPFKIDFEQNLVIAKNQPAYLSYIARGVPNFDSQLENFGYYVNKKYDFELSDESKSTSYSMLQSLTVFPVDSITTYKINKVTNTCGTPGEAVGSAIVKWREGTRRITIKTAHGGNDVCKGDKFGLKVESNFINTETNVTVEFSTSYNFSSSQIIQNQHIDKDNLLWLDIPTQINDNAYFYLRISASGIYSEQLNLRKIPKISKAVPSLSLTDINVGKIDISLRDSLENWIYNDISSIEINGNKKAYESVLFHGLEFPLPKKDTTFIISKVITACGNIPAEPKELKFSNDDYMVLMSNYDKSEFCINENITGRYFLSNPSHLANIDLVGNNITNGNFYSSETGAITNHMVITLFGDFPIDFDRTGQSFSAKIPDYLYSNIRSSVENNYSTVEDIIMNVEGKAKNSINATLYYTKGVKIKLKPEVWLTEKEIKAEKGYAVVPIKFLGKKINYELSNGHKGEIDLMIPNCFLCTPQSGGNTTIRIPVKETMTIRFTSVKNDCGEGKSYGETQIIVENEKPELVIDESTAPKKVCSGTEIEVSFKKTGVWNASEKIFLKTNPSYVIKERELTNEEINLGKVKIQVNSEMSTRTSSGYFWIEGGGISSNLIKVQAETKPSFSHFLLSGNNKTGHIENGHEVLYLLGNSRSYIMEWYSLSGVSNFVIDGKSVKPNRVSDTYESYNESVHINKDSSFTVNSVSNSCGTSEINKSYLLKTVPTLFTADTLPQDHNYCGGSKGIIEINYQGEIPNSDNWIIELAKVKSDDVSTFDFISIPSKSTGNKIEFTLPETLDGEYHFRVKSTRLNVYSDTKYFGSVMKKTMISLVSESEQTEVVGSPGANLYLKPPTEKFNDFWVRLNNGEFYSNYDFNLYRSYRYDNNSGKYIETLENRGKYFAPTQTTSYSIQSVHEACGIGLADGTVKIVISPKVQVNFSNQKNENKFCSGEETDLNLTYFGEFPTDTLMGVYLHSFDNPAYNYELNTFKNKQEKLSIKLPLDVNTGHYFIQVRKKSRASTFSTLFGNQISEAEKNDRLLNQDSEPLYVSLLSPPVVKISGNTEIFEGNQAVLNIKILNQNGEDEVQPIENVYYQLTLSNDSSYTTPNFSISVSPKKTETFTISSVKNACGIGKSTGSAIVTVYPITDNRLETRGFLRTHSLYERYYDYFNEFCANHSDSLDIEIYGKGNDLDLSKLAIQLSDGEGANYRTISVSKYSEVSSWKSEILESRLVRLWFQFPSDLSKGEDYRIKATYSNSNIPSTPLLEKVKISELPTANISGELMVIPGQTTIANVNFTGKAPWYVKITDQNDNSVYNNISNKINSDSEPTHNELIFNNKFPVELSVDKSNVFKVSEVYNDVCGEGKPGTGVLRVSLVLSNELQSKIQVQIYPNPTQDLLYFDFKNVENKTLIKVFDQSGRQVYNKEYLDNETKQRQTLSLEKLPLGLYLLNVSSGNFSQTYRVFKN